jgi:3-oxoacyl-[acyl-carrier protein] reductase
MEPQPGDLGPLLSERLGGDCHTCRVYAGHRLRTGATTREGQMLLEDKVAVVYGAGGPIGGAIARHFAAAGALVYLAGRTEAKLRARAQEIGAGGGRARTAVVDALDQPAVQELVGRVVAETDRLDVSVNVIALGDVQKPLQELTVQEFLQPITTAMRTQFIATSAAAGPMAERGGGVILCFGGSGPQTLPGLGGFKIALDAMEGLRRQWACELGGYGIRVLTLRTGGIPESLPQDFPGRDEIVAGLVEPTLLRRAATLADVGDVATFLASDLAASITSTEVNISCGAIRD